MGEKIPVTKKIPVTITQGNNLLRASVVMKMPEKLGDRTFSAKVRSKLNKKIRRLHSVLEKMSPIVDEEDLNYFGPRDAWRRRERSPEEKDAIEKAGLDVESDKIVYHCTSSKREVDVPIYGDAKDGLFWILCLWSHPESPHCLGAGQQQYMVWDIAEKIGATPALEKETGISDGETIEVEYEEPDTEPEEVPEDSQHVSA